MDFSIILILGLLQKESSFSRERELQQMQVGRIGDKPDQRHFYYSGGGYKKSCKPLHAVAFDRIDLSLDKSSDDNTWLKDFINAMPEETVRERIREFVDFCPEVEEVLCEKLIMEEL